MASCASDLLIVGGGFAGIVAALTTANESRRVAILEASTAPPRFSGDLIHPLGRQLLADIGLLPQLLSQGAVSIHGFAVFSGVRSEEARDGNPATLPYRDAVRGLAMDSRALVEALRAEVRTRPDIQLHCGCEAVEVLRRNGRVVGVRDSNGAAWFAPLTVIAQGRHGRLRHQLGFVEKPRPLSVSTALTLAGVTLPLPDYAHIFLNPRARNAGPLLAHPLGGGEVRVSIDLPRPLREHRLADLILREHLAHLPCEITEALREVLQGADVEDQLATRTTCAFRTQRCAAAGIAFLGDAAGCTHPITGTGMTTALVDARVLREELDRADARRGAAETRLDRALERYQRRRYHFARPRELLAEGLYEIFCGAESGSLALRKGLFHYWNASARARAVSLALLSGENSSMRTLFAEYLRVSTASARVIIAQRKMATRTADVSRLAGIARACLGTLGRFIRSAMSLRLSRYDCRPGVALSR